MLDRHEAMAAPDGRPLYPDVLAVGVPRGWKAGLRARAEAEGVSVAALVRDGIERLVKPRRRRRLKGC